MKREKFYAPLPQWKRMFRGEGTTCAEDEHVRRHIDNCGTIEIVDYYRYGNDWYREVRWRFEDLEPHRHVTICLPPPTEEESKLVERRLFDLRNK